MTKEFDDAKFVEHGSTHSSEEQHITAGKHIKNPLAGISQEQLAKDVEAFAVEKGLVDELPVLHKGARLAQNPANFEALDCLDEEDKNTIRYEFAHKWSHPKTLYATIFLCSIGAATQGWDQTGSNGANLSFPAEFGINAAEGETNYVRDSYLVGLVNSGPYFGASLVGVWLADPVNNYFGRRGAIFLTAIILVATPIASAFTHSWGALLAVRLVMGIGMGLKGASVPVFAGENSPAQIRGALVMGWQFWTAFGIFLGFCANAIVAHTGKIAWRLQLGSAFIPALPLAIGIYFCPESPRWLMKKNKYRQAYDSLLRLRFTPLQAARDLYYIHVQLEIEKGVLGGASYFSRFTELFTIPRVKRATLASGVVMIAQQMCGINIIAFYSSTVFEKTGYTALDALYASIGFGAINFIFAGPAFFTIDTFGRRSLLLCTFPGMFLTLLLAGLCYLVDDAKTRLGLVATWIYVFAAIYSPGEGPVPFTYSAEVFDIKHREQGMAWAVFMCFFWAGILSMTFPRLVDAITVTGAFGFYAGLNVVAFILILLFVPETKQLSLEELDNVFNIPTKSFIRHTMHEAVPYWFQRYVFRNKDATLRPLLYRDDLPTIPAEQKGTTQHIDDVAAKPQATHLEEKL